MEENHEGSCAENEQLSSKQKLLFAKSPGIKRVISSELLAGDKAAVSSKLSMARSRWEAACLESQPLSLSACRYSEAEVKSLDEAWHQFDAAQHDVSATVKSWCQAPDVVQEPVLLDGQYLYEPTLHKNSPVEKPSWLGPATVHRNESLDTTWGG